MEATMLQRLDFLLERPPDGDWLIVGTLLEERKLVIEFGEEYKRYQDHVSMFIQLNWLTRKRIH